jgi:hypothetical protein
MSSTVHKLTLVVMFAASLSVPVGCGGAGSDDPALTLDAVCGTERLRGQTTSITGIQTTKIVGGKECQAPNGTVVKLLLFDEEDNQTICSGVRLNSTTVLTAAHCINEFVFSVLVELASGERIAPSKITLHPEATNLGSLFVNDVALLSITPPEDETAPPAVPIAERVAAGDLLAILGYGATDGISPASSGVLRIGEMRVAEVTPDSIFSDYAPPTLSNTCFGDSGGPAFVDDGAGGIALAGITSTGTNITCSLGDRSAFTNLTNQELQRFIEEGM